VLQIHVRSALLLLDEHEKTNSEQSFVVTSKLQEETRADNCDLPNIAKKVGSYDMLVTGSECQESGNLNLSTQKSCTVSQSSSGNAVSAASSVSGVMSHSVIKRSGQKVPETKNKQHEGGLVTRTLRNTAHFMSQSASSCSYSLSTTAINSPSSESVLKYSSVSLSTNSCKPGTGSHFTESAIYSVKAVMNVPKQSVPHHSHSLMPSQCWSYISQHKQSHRSLIFTW
jgi:hypothetical protein